MPSSPAGEAGEAGEAEESATSSAVLAATSASAAASTRCCARLNNALKGRLHDSKVGRRSGDDCRALVIHQCSASCK